MRRVWLTCLVALALAGCGEESGGGGGDTQAETTETKEATETQATQSPPEPECGKAKRSLVESLEDTLTGGGRLTGARYVEVEDPPEDPPLNGFREGVYIVAARASGETLAWAVSQEMLDTGGGAGLGVDEATLEASQLGAAANPGSPAADYTDVLRASEAYDRARECAAR